MRPCRVQSGHIFIKADSERSTAAREALVKHHDCNVITELPPGGERQSSGATDGGGKTVRECARVLREQIEARPKPSSLA